MKSKFKDKGITDLPDVESPVTGNHRQRNKV